MFNSLSPGQLQHSPSLVCNSF